MQTNIRALWQDTNLKSAIFDMDGTLLDSMPMWYSVPALYLESKNITGFDKEALWQEFKTTPLNQAPGIFRDRCNIKDSPQKIIYDIKNLIFLQYSQKLQLKKGAKEYLDFLFTKGIPCALATATDRDCVEACFRRLGLTKYFPIIATCAEARQGKRDGAKVFDLARQKLQLKKEECLIFEDALHAIITAKDAGYKVAALKDVSCEKAGEWQKIKQIADWSFEGFF